MRCGIKQHPKSEEHFVISKTRFSTRHSRFEKNTEGKVTLLKSQNQQFLKVTILWTIKLAEEDFSFRSCEDLNTLFKHMFSSNVTEKFALSRQKVSCVAKAALGPVILENIVEDVKITPAVNTMIDGSESAKINGFSCKIL